MQTINRNFGAALIVAGTTIGAGMLALPISSASLGFPLTVIMMVIFWLLMLYAANLYVRLCKLVNEPVSLPTMCEKLGFPGLLPVISIILCLLFYALIAAYLTGASSVLHKHIPETLQKQLSIKVLICFLTIIFAAITMAHRHWSDYLNRLMVAIKVLAFLTMLTLLYQYIDNQRLMEFKLLDLQSAEVWQSIPIVFTSFGFHGSIPSILSYIGVKNPKATKVFIYGSGLPCLVYLLWVGTTLGVLPLTGTNSFATIAEHAQDVGTLIMLLGVVSSSSSLLKSACATFSLLAIITSLFGVGLGLYDFFQERFATEYRRLKSIIVTFTPPLIFALFYPRGFILALGFAAIYLALLALVIPCTLCLYLKQRFPLSFKLEKLLILFVLLIGIIIIKIEIISIILR